ncbi:carbon-nitrogen hydrolase family protein [Roseateles sp. BYS180W]|uniref:Carbon-nitrogen hydrolase family protein n=1 Tax=Roseateles rivi TaxID=3299028 RepID=A0ABW7FTZ6_9BURK
MQVALIQLDCKINRASGNMRRAQRYVEQAAAQGADLVCLPESFLASGNVLEVASVAVTLPGPELDELCALARRCGVYLLAGLFEREGLDCYSSAVLIGRDGQLCARYRRMHCFDMERQYLRCGDSPCCVDTEFGRLGLILGYDLNFPEACRALYQQGAELLCCLALIPEQYAYVTHALLRARAIENQCYVLFASGVGANVYAGFSYMGRSAVWADPLYLEEERFDFVDGQEQLLDMGAAEGCALVSLAPERLRRYRQTRSLMGDTRWEAYATPTTPNARLAAAGA